MKLFWKILSVYFLAWALLTATVFATLFLDLRTEFIPRSPISQNLPASVGVQLATSHLFFGDEASFRQLAEVWNRGEPPYAVNRDGRELLGRAVDPVTLALARSLAMEATERAEDARPSPVQRLTTPSGSEYVVFYPDGLGPEDGSPLRWFFRWPWLLAVFFAAVGLLLAAGLSAAWTRPISSLERSFDGFAAGDLSLDLGPEVLQRRDEIGDLARHFEGMAQKLAGSVASQRRLLHDVSHELRSPLARLSVAVELARRKPEEIEIALRRIEKENERLDRMIREVLTLARLESEASGEAFEGAEEEYFDLLELLRTIHDDVEFEAEAVGMRVELVLPQHNELVMRGRAELLHRALENVVRNALQHAEGASQIELQLEEPGAAEHLRRGRLRLRIGDDGQAPVPEDLDSLFNVFTHGAGSQGFGLGLAIAQRAIAVHGGSIRATPGVDGGVDFVIELPYRGARDDAGSGGTESGAAVP
ncbi:MAG: HAMP domain-containing sensor histidine kinase [Acidobacteriota bacterium]